MADITEPLNDSVEQITPAGVPVPEESEAQRLDGDPTLLSDSLIVTDEEPPPIGRSWAFDFASEQFIPAAGGSPLKTYGAATLRFWVEKCLRTPRGSRPIHDAEYGMRDLWSIIGSAPDIGSEADIEERVREAVTFHPRISDVAGFFMEWSEEDEAIYLTFTVVTDDDEALSFDAMPLGAA